MNEVNVNGDNCGQLGAYESSRPDKAVHRSAEDARPSAPVRMRDGKGLVIVGSAISILGIVIYCMSTIAPNLGGLETVYIRGGLFVIGAGFLCWLAGAVRYLNAAIDLNSSDDVF